MAVSRDLCKRFSWVRPIGSIRLSWLPPQIPQAAQRGIHKGAPALLWGEPAASMRASVFCWLAACFRRGGNPPAPAFPRRGKRERGRSNSLLPQAIAPARIGDGKHTRRGYSRGEGS